MKSATYKSFPARKLPKTDREQAVLLGVVELYLKSTRPIGSQTLQENGFKSLSTATIRNYFGKMEEQGYLKQQHTSGGRIPTAKAFRFYADHFRHQGLIEDRQEANLHEAFSKEGREIAASISRAAETLSEETQCAVFISTPRFDQDFIQDVRLLMLENDKILSVLITDFGLIRTETIYLDQAVNASFLRSAEEYFLWRMNKGEKALFQSEAESKLAQRIYNEVMVRHVVGYANFPAEDIVRTGLSKLLTYQEFNDAAALARSLSLLEDQTQMRALLRECCKQNQLVSWIGDELCPYVPPESECSVISIPYKIGEVNAGAVAILGPMRLPYRNIFGLLQSFSERLSRTLTERVYTFKIAFRQPEKRDEAIEKSATSIQLEHRRNP
jgi:heat-inducible transcriptional repressor